VIQISSLSMLKMPSEPASSSLSIVFFGTSSQYSLKPLLRINAEHRLAGIVESGKRGCKQHHLTIFDKAGEFWRALWREPSLWVTSLRLKVPYFYLCKGNEDHLAAFLQQINPDVGCVASFNQLLPGKIIKIPRLGMINIHPSLLPKYRGPNVWFWLYHEMETEGGATIHFIDEGEDTGDILKQASLPIPLGMEPNLLRQITINLGAELLSEVLKHLPKGSLSPIPQRQLKSLPRARRLKDHEDLFNWQTWSLQHTYHFLRGTLPYQPIFSDLQGFWGKFNWFTGSYEPQKGLPGQGLIRLDMKGFYFVHPEGKIRLRLATSTFQKVVLVLAGLALLISFFL
jgi:methionyl-tRNA formyltransferase